MITVYGIRNCDTVKKARRWLDEHGVAYRFHDFRADGLDEATLRAWCNSVVWETLLNRRGATWRALPEHDKAVADQAAAVVLMLAHPALIKRPVLVKGNDLLVGFDENAYAKLAVS
ncbi:MAG: ArsC family reductase [Thiohalomonadaceae bacterium]